MMTVLCLLSPASAEEERAWTVGFSAQEILPDAQRLERGEYFLAGYSSNHPASGLLDAQYARAVWLDDGSGEGGVILMAVDCVGLTSVDTGVIRDRLSSFSEETGCRYVHVCATHTHAGIDTLGLWGPIAVSGRDPDFMETLYSAAETAAREAYENRQTGRLYLGSAELPESFLRDSRKPAVMDTTLTCLRFQPEDGGGGLRILHFPAHAEALRAANSLISADYPGVMGRIIREETGDDFMYVTGAVGGLIMTEQLDEDVYKSLELTGRTLAEAALSITDEEELPPAIVRESVSFDVPLENEVFAVMQCLGVLRSDAVPHQSPTGAAIRTQMTYLELGGLPLILTPGELFPELALGMPDGFAGDNPQAADPESFSEILGTDRFLVIGLADDEIGYIVPPSDFRVHETLPYLERAEVNGRKHYEETNSVGPDAAGCVAQALETLVKRVQTKDKE